MREMRRQYLVNKKMQMQFVRILTTQAAVLIMTFGALLYLINKMYLLHLQAIVGSSVIPDTEVRAILTFSIVAILGILVIAGLLLAFLGIRFSHQVAGPLHKIESSMDKLARGEKVELIRFRKNDIMNGIGDKFNMIARKMGQVK